MNICAALFSFALLLCKIRAQVCGPPILPPPLHPPHISTPQQIIPAAQVAAPVVGTTVIDNSLSSALANVLQLLIVSDLIESTLNTALGHHSVPLPSPICDPIVPQSIVYSPTVEILTPTPEYVSPCSSIIDFIPPRGPIIDVIPQHSPVFDCVPKFGPVLDVLPPCAPGCPVFDFSPQYGPVFDCKPCAPPFDFIPSSGPIIEFMPPISPIIEYPCGPVFDYAPPCCPYIETLPNFYGEYLPVPNYCGGVTEYVAYAPNLIAGPPELIGPLQIPPPMPNCYNGLPELACPCGHVGACNIGNVPTSLPCVNLNVEPMSCCCGYGNSIIPNSYFY